MLLANERWPASVLGCVKHVLPGQQKIVLKTLMTGMGANSDMHSPPGPELQRCSRSNEICASWSPPTLKLVTIMMTIEQNQHRCLLHVLGGTDVRGMDGVLCASTA